MSVNSRAKTPKQPSPNRSKKRAFPKDWKPPMFSFTDFANQAHKANTLVLKPRGGFGGRLKSLRPKLEKKPNE